jgi:probable phosphomutase (TIGR03848 family)
VRNVIFVALFLAFGKRIQAILKMGVTTYVLLIRHGENEFVSTHRLAGRTPDVHLNEKGRTQAQKLVTCWAGQRIDVIYSSPLERCLETAAPLAAARDLPVHTEMDIVEVDYGGWQGGDLRELSKQPEWGQVQHFPSFFRFPDGETLREVQARAVSAVERIRADHPDQIVALFSHGDVIRTTLAHYLGVPLDLFQRIVVSTAAVSVLAFFDNRPGVLGVNYGAEFPVCIIKKPEAETHPSEEQTVVDASNGKPTA